MILTILIFGYLFLNVIVSLHRIKTNYNVIYPLTYRSVIFSCILYILIWISGYTASEEKMNFRTLNEEEARILYGGNK